MVLNRRRRETLGGGSADRPSAWRPPLITLGFVARLSRSNALISAGTLPANVDSAAARVQFALARAQAASGAGEAALNRYGALQGTGARPGGAIQRRQPVVAPGHGASTRVRNRASVGADRAGQGGLPRHPAPLPADWPARYNLERAQRLVPDPDELDERAAGGEAQCRARRHHDAWLFPGAALSAGAIKLADRLAAAPDGVAARAWTRPDALGAGAGRLWRWGACFVRPGGALDAFAFRTRHRARRDAEHERG